MVHARVTRTFGCRRRRWRRAVGALLVVGVGGVVLPSTAEAPVSVLADGWAKGWAACLVAGLLVLWAVWWSLPVLSEQLDRDGDDR